MYTNIYLQVEDVYHYLLNQDFQDLNLYILVTAVEGLLFS